MEKQGISLEDLQKLLQSRPEIAYSVLGALAGGLTGGVGALPFLLGGAAGAGLGAYHTGALQELAKEFAGPKKPSVSTETPAVSPEITPKTSVIPPETIPKGAVPPLPKDLVGAHVEAILGYAEEEARRRQRKGGSPITEGQIPALLGSFLPSVPEGVNKSDVALRLAGRSARYYYPKATPEELKAHTWRMARDLMIKSTLVGTDPYSAAFATGQKGRPQATLPGVQLKTDDTGKVIRQLGHQYDVNRLDLADPLQREAHDYLLGKALWHQIPEVRDERDIIRALETEHFTQAGGSKDYITTPGGRLLRAIQKKVGLAEHARGMARYFPKGDIMTDKWYRQQSNMLKKMRERFRDKPMEFYRHLRKLETGTRYQRQMVAGIRGRARSMVDPKRLVMRPTGLSQTIFGGSKPVWNAELRKYILQHQPGWLSKDVGIVPSGQFAFQPVMSAVQSTFAPYTGEFMKDVERVKDPYGPGKQEGFNIPAALGGIGTTAALTKLSPFFKAFKPGASRIAGGIMRGPLAAYVLGKTLTRGAYTRALKGPQY